MRSSWRGYGSAKIVRSRIVATPNVVRAFPWRRDHVSQHCAQEVEQKSEKSSEHEIASRRATCMRSSTLRECNRKKQMLRIYF